MFGEKIWPQPTAIRPGQAPVVPVVWIALKVTFDHVLRIKEAKALEDFTTQKTPSNGGYLGGYVAGIHLHTKNLSMHREVHISTYLQVTLFWDLLCLQPKTCPAL